MFKLNPLLNYVLDAAKGRGYIVTPEGGCNVVNGDAFLLLTSDIEQWRSKINYRDFFDQAVSLGWIGPDLYGSPRIRRVSTPIHLKRIQLELLLRCNLECAHCYCLSSPKASGGLPTTDIYRLIDEAAEMGVLYLDITGGEPLMRNDVFDIVARAQEKGIIVSLFTNATTITWRTAKRLASLGISAIQTSLDAYTPEAHDAFRGQPGAHSRTVRGIRLLREFKVPVSVTITVHRGNAHELKRLADFVERDLRVPYALDRVIPAGRALAGDGIALTNKEYYELLRKEFPGKARNTAKICDFASAIIEKSNIEPSCGVGISYLFIKHDGRVVLCPTMTEDESPDFEAGSLTHSDLRTIWMDHPTFKRYRGVQCGNVDICSAGKTCRGGCRSNAYLLHGKTDSPDELQCNLHKNTGPGYVDFIARYDAGEHGPVTGPLAS